MVADRLIGPDVVELVAEDSNEKNRSNRDRQNCESCQKLCFFLQKIAKIVAKLKPEGPRRKFFLLLYLCNEGSINLLVAALVLSTKKLLCLKPTKYFRVK